MNRASALIALAVLLSTVMALMVASTHRMEHAVTYYESALHSLTEPQTVHIGSATYTVNRGKIEATQPVSTALQFRVLTVAYALMLARDMPLLDLAGSDPARIQSAAELLEQIMERYASHQATSTDQPAVRALYPTAALKAAAQAEAARQSFLSSSSDIDMARYNDAINRAIEARSIDAHRFATAFKKVVGPDQARFPQLGGTITTNRMYAAIGVIESSISELRRQAATRRECLRGAVERCPVLFANERTGVPSDVFETPTSTLQTRLFLKEARGAAFVARPIIALNESVCLRALPSPYFFLATDENSSVPLFLNEMYFTQTRAGDTVTGFLQNVRGISYSLFNPMNYYLCPEFGHDISQVIATLLTARYAGVENAYSDTEARSYVQESLATCDNNCAYLHDLQRMFQDKGAGLDRAIERIAHTAEGDLDRVESGIPYDVRARTLFLTHSAFPTLFQLYNPSFGGGYSGVTEQNPSDYSRLGGEIITLSELSKKISRSLIVRDIQEFLAFEKGNEDTH